MVKFALNISTVTNWKRCNNFVLDIKRSFGFARKDRQQGVVTGKSGPWKTLGFSKI